MINVAIVEDDNVAAEALAECIKRYEKEYDEDFAITRYCEAVTFLEERKNFDIVFMDIMLPNLTGMEATAKLREYDNNTTVLIFVTSMAQFAIKGYEVNAFDYILKPIKYERLFQRLKKAIQNIHESRGRRIAINAPKGVVFVLDTQICYIEVSGHKLTYHTTIGDYSEYGTSLNNVETLLKGRSFLRCNACYLVNPNFIERVNHRDLLIILKSGEQLKISQPRRKNFMSELTNWLGQRGC